MWDDAEEPPAAKIDVHVTDNVKHEVKPEFDLYGADMAEVMGLNMSARSISMSAKSSARMSKRVSNLNKDKKGLLRKMSMKLSEPEGIMKKAES